MNTLQGTEDLRLDHEPMEREHRAFTERLAEAQAATDAELPLAWGRLVAHAVAQFGEEDRRMRETDFATADHHTLQHRVVLNVLHEGLVLARSVQPDRVREMAAEVAAWFARHTRSQDAALALHLRAREQPRPAPVRRAGAASRRRAA
jgi:hemerythrin